MAFMSKRAARGRARWVVDVRNKNNHAVVSSRYYDTEKEAIIGYQRALSRHVNNKLIEVRVYSTDVRLPI